MEQFRRRVLGLGAYRFNLAGAHRAAGAADFCIFGPPLKSPVSTYIQVSGPRLPPSEDSPLTIEHVITENPNHGTSLPPPGTSNLITS